MGIRDQRLEIERLRDWEIESPIVNRQSQLISTTIPAPGLTPEQLLAHADGQERFYWQAAQGTAAFAGFGAAADLRAWGSTRFESIQKQARQLFAEAIVEDAGQPLAAPRLFGGFSFRDDFTPDNTWAVFHPAQFILPHYQLVQTAGESWLTINATIPPEEEPQTILSELRSALQARYTLLQTQQTTVTSEVTVTSLNYPMPYETWREMIGQATGKMRTGELNKVVLSRVCEIRFNGRTPITAALHTLNQSYPDCYRFLFEPRPNHAFYGATPELLAQVHGRDLITMGLAGSIRRGKTAQEDEALGRELLTSQKDLYEHAIVVQAIRQRLKPLLSELMLPDQPDLLRLGYIQHLHTPVHGRLHTPTGILPIVKILHPTPALGGAPRPLAMQFIREAEPVPRGWYAAPVGWLDHHLDGAFGVAIRSAVAQDHRVWLHAGGGIVAASEPQKEWEETQLKFKPMLQTLGIDG
ncbi:MAG: isochorismate synthase [Chloroflexi bacterium]|nr:isochorismate synthase [Chloroflexota bacterium]